MEVVEQHGVTAGGVPVGGVPVGGIPIAGVVATVPAFLSHLFYASHCVRPLWSGSVCSVFEFMFISTPSKSYCRMSNPENQEWWDKMLLLVNSSANPA